MAIDLENEYPGQVNPSSAPWPFGEPRNITIPGDGTGTPWERRIVKDLVAWQQGILLRAGLTPSGTPDTALVSQILQAMFGMFGEQYPTLQDLIDADNLVTGTYVSTADRYLLGDGGGEVYLILAVGAVPTDGFNYVLLADNRIAQLIPKRSLGAILTSKMKPTVAGMLRDVDALIAMDQLKLGDGRLSPGTNATDLVYRTAHNTQGGTFGTFAVSARYGVDVNAGGGTLSFSCQIDPAFSAGVQVRGFRHNDPLFPTTGITYFALTDMGGGLFQLAGVNPALSTYYGIEVKLTPVDATNDETLHDEYFVIQDMVVTQDAVNLIDQTAALLAATFAQYVKVAFPLAFTTQTLNNGTNDVLITHTQNISGARLRYVWASPTGSTSGDGSEFDEMDLTTARPLLNSGACNNLILRPGTFTLTGKKPTDILAPSGQYSMIVCPEGEAVIDTGVLKTFASMTLVGSHYEVAYAETNHYNATLIGSGGATPKIVLRTLTENLTEQASSALVDANDWSFWWDNAAKKFHIRFDGTLTDDVIVCEAGNTIKTANVQEVKVANTKMYGSQAAFLDLNNVRHYETYNTGTELGCAAGDVFTIVDSNGFQVDDYVIKSQTDGYNYHGSGHTELYDCVGEFCKDDGCSHHDDCTGYIQGGRFDANGKGGVIPAFGARVICFGVTADDNVDGDSSLAQDFNYGGFVALSDDSDTTETVMICLKCSADGNAYGFLSSGGKSTAIVQESLADNSTIFDYGCATWGSNTDRGRLDLIRNAAGTIDDDGVMAVRIFD